MKRKIIISVAALGLAGLTAANVAQAFNFGNMMNPSRWFDSDRDRYYDRDYGRGYYGGYGGGPYGWGGPYGGYGGGPYGWGGPYGGWGGYGGPYGYGGGYPSTIVVSPSSEGSKAPPPKMPE